MRCLKVGLLFLLLLPALVAQAQDNACDVDISGVVALLEEAQARASDNDAGEARKLMQDALAEIEILIGDCKGDIDLSEQQTIQLTDGDVNGELSFSYPVGWLTAEEQADFPSVLIASNSAALGKPLDDATPPPFATGEMLIALGVANTGSMGVSDDLGMSPQPADFIANIVTPAEDTLGKPSEPTIRAVNDHPAAWVTFTGSSDFEMLLMMIDMQLRTPDGRAQYVLMFAITAPGELLTLEPTLEAMANTFRLKLNP